MELSVVDGATGDRDLLNVHVEDLIDELTKMKIQNT